MPAGQGESDHLVHFKGSKSESSSSGFGGKEIPSDFSLSLFPFSGLVDFFKAIVWYLKVLSFEPSSTVQDSLSLKSPSWKKESEERNRTFTIPPCVALCHPRCCFSQQNPSANISGGQEAGQCRRQFGLPGSTHCI